MAIQTDSPLVAALLCAAEKVYGRPVRTPADFVLLAERTLNVISNYIGCPHFQAFTKHIAELGIIESELITGTQGIKSDELSKGDRIRIAWQPDRECVLEYLGNRKFVVVKAVNSKIEAGDCFFCSLFIKGRPLYVDNLTHGGETFESYAMGTEQGLTAVSREPNT